MKLLKDFRYYSSIIVFFIMLNNCASFRKNDAQLYSSINTNTKNKSVSVILKGKVLEGENEDYTYKYSEKTQKKYKHVWLNSSQKAFKDIRIFSEVDVIFPDTTTENIQKNISDYSVEIDIKHINNTSCLYDLGYILFIGSGGIVPTVKSVSIDINYTIRDKKNNKIKEYKKSEKIETYYHILLIFAIPFTDLNELKGIPNIYEKIYYDMNIEMLTQGINEKIFY